MKFITFSFILFGVSLISFGQKEQMSYESIFATPDTSFTIKLKMGERHGLWKMQCYQNRDFYSDGKYAPDQIRDSIQRFFQSKMEGLLEPKLLDRLHCSVIEVFNETKTVDAFTNIMDTPRCHEIHYEFQCFFMFDDSLWFPLHIYVDNDEKLMHQSSILETLSSLESYTLPSRTELFEKMYQHRKFEEYPVNSTFWVYYSEERKLFYVEFISSWGEEIERIRNNVKVKKQHIFVDAFTGKILWKPKVMHEHGGGSCTIWTRIHLPKNSLVGTR